ncbi:MAG: T9SS type A sorting domain-containing protein [Candidatus Zhuqueibacterota bacterium]
MRCILKILGIFTLAVFVFQSAVFGQKSYNIYKVDPANPIQIDGQVEEIWNKVQMEPCNTVVKDYTATHGIDPNPPDSDYKINFGALWNEDGIYFLVRIVDDILVFDNEGTADWDGSQTPTPRWWRDDSFNWLTTSDLQTPVGGETQQIWEFAWIVKNPVEVKASYEMQWTFPEDIECAWIEEGNNTYTAEVFIKWQAFLGAPDSGWIPLEFRGRDDDLAGEKKYPQTFYQWNSDSSTTHEDSTLFTGKAYLLDEIISTSVAQNSVHAPVEFSLSQNYPNPFNPTTHIHFNLSRPGRATLQIFDVQGRLVATLIDGMVQAGIHNITFDASHQPSGIYFYKLESGGAFQIKKMMLVK